MSGGDARSGKGPVRLPVVGGRRPEGGATAGAAEAAESAESAAQGRPAGGGGEAGGRGAAGEAPWWRLLTTLVPAGVIAGLLIVVVYDLTLPRIQANKARVLHHAIQEVLEAPARYDTLFVFQGALVEAPPSGAGARGVEQIYVGYREDGERIGFAVVAAEPGFQDIVRLIFGYDPATHRLLGMKVLDSRETPGLGDKILSDSAFIREFQGAEPPLVGIRAGAGAKGLPGEIDMITGATISSRTVIAAINHEIERLKPLMDAYTGNGER